MTHWKEANRTKRVDHSARLAANEQPYPGEGDSSAEPTPHAGPRVTDRWPLCRHCHLPFRNGQHTHSLSLYDHDYEPEESE